MSAIIEPHPRNIMHVCDRCWQLFPRMLYRLVLCCSLRCWQLFPRMLGWFSVALSHTYTKQFQARTRPGLGVAVTEFCLESCVYVRVHI